jgi:hypothetical protein
MMSIVPLAQMIKDIDTYLTDKDITKVLEICDKFELILSALPTEGNQYDSDTTENLYNVQQITLKLFERMFGEKATLDQENTENFNNRRFSGGWFAELVEFRLANQTINIIGNQVEYLSTLSRSAQRLIILINNKLIYRQFPFELPVMHLKMFPKKFYFYFNNDIEYEMIETNDNENPYDYFSMFRNKFEIITNESGIFDSQISLLPYEYYYVCMIRYPNQEDVHSPNSVPRRTKDSTNDAGFILKTKGPYHWLIGCPYLFTLQQTLETLYPCDHNIMNSENKKQKQLLFIHLVIGFWIENNSGGVKRKNINLVSKPVLPTQVPILEYGHIFDTWKTGTLQGIYLLLLQLMKNPSNTPYIDIIRRPLFDMLRTIFARGKASYVINHMPVFTIAVEIWLLFCQPWAIDHFIDSRKPNAGYSDKWRSYVCANIHFYTTLLSIFLSVGFPNSNYMFYLQHSFINVIDLFNHTLLNKTISYFVKLFQNKKLNIEYINNDQCIVLDVVENLNIENRDNNDYQIMVLLHETLFPDPSLYIWIDNGTDLDDYGILSGI